MYNTGDRLIVVGQISEAALLSKPSQTNIILPEGTKLKVSGKIAGGGLMVESSKPIQTVHGSAQTMFIVPPQVLNHTHIGQDDAKNMLDTGTSLNESSSDFMSASAQAVNCAIPKQKGATPDLRRTNACISGAGSDKDFMRAKRPAKDGQKLQNQGAIMFTDMSVKENWDACIHAGSSQGIADGVLQELHIDSRLSNVTSNVLTVAEGTLSGAGNPQGVLATALIASATVKLGQRFEEEDAAGYNQFAEWATKRIATSFPEIRSKLPFMEQKINIIEAKIGRSEQALRVLESQGAFKFVTASMLGLAGRLRLQENADAARAADVFEMIGTRSRMIGQRGSLGESFADGLDAVDAYYAEERGVTVNGVKALAESILHRASRV